MECTGPSGLASDCPCFLVGYSGGSGFGAAALPSCLASGYPCCCVGCWGDSDPAVAALPLCLGMSAADWTGLAVILHCNKRGKIMTPQLGPRGGVSLFCVQASQSAMEHICPFRWGGGTLGVCSWRFFPLSKWKESYPEHNFICLSHLHSKVYLLLFLLQRPS